MYEPSGGVILTSIHVVNVPKRVRRRSSILKPKQMMTFTMIDHVWVRLAYGSIPGIIGEDKSQKRHATRDGTKRVERYLPLCYTIANNPMGPRWALGAQGALRPLWDPGAPLQQLATAAHKGLQLGRRDVVTKVSDGRVIETAY